MSSYIKTTKHPITGKWRKAFWIDDYFGSHRYGVLFIKGKGSFNKLGTEYKDCEVFDPEKTKLETK
jgi:hypothetical protein